LTQAVKCVLASYGALVNTFERIQYFLFRLDRYTAVALTPEMTLLLGKIMAQVLSVLALSTKEMKEGRISETFRLTFSLMADYGTEKLMKRLVGKTDVEQALERLDMLTKEENLMAAARSLEVTNRVDDKVTTIKDVVHDVDGNVKTTKELTQSIHDDVKVNKHGAHHSFDVFVPIVTIHVIRRNSNG